MGIGEGFGLRRLGGGGVGDWIQVALEPAAWHFLASRDTSWAERRSDQQKSRATRGKKGRGQVGGFNQLIPTEG